MASVNQSTSGSSLGEILEKVLDKGVVIAGDISIALADVELLTIKIRLVVASIDKAEEMGIDWWANDPYLSSRARIPEKAITGNGESEHIQSPDEVADFSSMTRAEAEPVTKWTEIPKSTY